MSDVTRKWHHTHVVDANARPLFLGLSGVTIIVFMISLATSIIGFSLATQFLGIPFLPSLVGAGALPLIALGVLLRFYTKKPANYAMRWVEYQKLKKSNTPLLSQLPLNHEE